MGLQNNNIKKSRSNDALKPQVSSLRLVHIPESLLGLRIIRGARPFAYLYGSTLAPPDMHISLSSRAKEQAPLQKTSSR